MNSRARQVVLGCSRVFLVALLLTGCQRSKPARQSTSSLSQATSTEVASGQEPADSTRAAPAATTSGYPEPATVTLAAISPTPEPAPAVISPTPEPTPLLAATIAVTEPTPLASATLLPTSLLSTPLPTGEINYIVRTGDSLLALATTYQTTPQAIMARNSLPNDRIEVGQVLIIPVGVQTSDTPVPSTVRHVVKVGETLSALARRYHTTVAAIRSANPPIADPDHLTVGSVLTITVGTAPSVRTHTVRRGESLARIARQYGVSLAALVEANALTDPNEIRAGQVLVIP